MKVAIYVRVSTEEQAKEGYSIEAQKNRLAKFVESQEDWEIYDFFIDDGYSAKDLNRPEIKRLVSGLKEKKFDVVLVYRLDRLVRSVLNLHELLEKFDKYDVKFKSATEVFDTTSAIGRFFITLVGAMAQWERENTAERVKMGMDTKALSGARNGATPPFGYDLENGTLVINPIEAEVVKRIFAMYNNGNGIKAIVTAFNRENVPKRGAEWAYGSLYYILNNPVYYGMIRWNYRKFNGNLTGNEMLIDGEHNAIISEKEFEQSQTVRKGRKKEGKRSTSAFVYTGVLKCNRCGYAMIGGSRKVKNGRISFYRCMGRFHKGKCNMPIIKEDNITKLLLDHLALTIDDEIIQQMAVTTDSNEPDYVELRNQLEADLEQIKKRKKRWQLAFGEGAITIDELKSHTSEDTKTEEYYKKQLAELPKENERSQVDVNELATQLRLLKDIWNTLEIQTQKEIIRSCFESITVDADESDFKPGPGNSIPVILKEYALNL